MDKWKVCGKNFLFYMALVLVLLAMMGMIFQAIGVTEEDMVGNTIFRSIFMIWLPVAVIALFVVRARKKGFADMSYNLMIERKTLNAGGQAYQPTPEEAEHCFKPSKGFLIGFVSFAPPVLFALLALIFSGVPSAFAVFDPICRILLNPYLLLFGFVIDDVMAAYAFLPLSLILPLSYAIAYYTGGRRFRKEHPSLEEEKARAQAAG